MCSLARTSIQRARGRYPNIYGPLCSLPLQPVPPPTMIARQDENEAEVRREDQDRINRFARLNARLNENRAEREEVKVNAVVSRTQVDNVSSLAHFVFALLVAINQLLLHRGLWKAWMTRALNS
jgi:hypothetical protein